MAVVILDEVTFLIRLLSDNWDAASTALHASGGATKQINAAVPSPKIIDIRSLLPKEGRRVDADSDSAIIIVYEDSNSIEYPTIDYSVRNETFNFTIHMRVLHRRDYAELTTSRDKLQDIYRIVRYILESKSLRPTVTTTDGGTTNIQSAEIIKLKSRSEANDRNKRLLGYKLSVEMRRYGRS
tara:strand:+ start:1855 stop:2403 length:549 start_codon:yes stop_codon:yes gene_type:complete